MPDNIKLVEKTKLHNIYISILAYQKFGKIFPIFQSSELHIQYGKFPNGQIQILFHKTFNIKLTFHQKSRNRKIYFYKVIYKYE